MSEPLTVNVNRRHQITLPRALRERLNIQPGDRLLAEVQGDVIVLVPEPKDYVQRLAGLHREVWEGVDTTAYLRRERQGASQAVERLSHMSLPVSDWEQMERESTTYEPLE